MLLSICNPLQMECRRSSRCMLGWRLGLLGRLCNKSSWYGQPQLRGQCYMITPEEIENRSEIKTPGKQARAAHPASRGSRIVMTRFWSRGPRGQVHSGAARAQDGGQDEGHGEDAQQICADCQQQGQRRIPTCSLPAAALKCLLSLFQPLPMTRLNSSCSSDSKRHVQIQD